MENKRKILTRIAVLVMALVMAIGTLAVPANAEINTDGFVINGYEVFSYNTSIEQKTITKGQKVDIVVSFTDSMSELYTSIMPIMSGSAFSTTDAAGKVSGNTIKFSGITYSGNGNKLQFNINFTDSNSSPTNSGSKMVNIPITQCVEEEPPVYEPSAPTTYPMPTVIFSRNEITNSIKAGQSFNMTISVKNVGTQTMTKPIISFTTSDSLMVTGTQTAYEMNTIAPGKTESITVPFKALDKISSPNQSVTANVDFTYYTGGSNTNGKASGTLNVPCKTSEKQESTDGAGIPVPNIIVSNFNYGGSSVPSGSQFALDIKLRNTSSEAAVENVVATVSGGSELIINGGTNTKYFSKIGAGQTANITIPFKVAQILTTTAEPVSVAVNYEYVTEGTRKQASSNLTLSVPVYQTDKFEIEQPVFAYEPAVYEETSFTMEYVNKGKSAVSNVEATVSGDVESYQATQRLGNIEAGKSGTIAFAVTPTLEGENHVYVTINYEDANGDIKERVFETVVNAYQMSYDPVEPVEPMPQEPTGPNWKIIIPIIVLALIIGLIVFRKLHKKSKAKKQTKLWEEWEDEDDAPKDDTPETENKSEENDSQDENKEVK